MIYYLPGHGGRLSTGLGQALTSRGYEVLGRELYGEFKMLPFQAQIDHISEDLQSKFWDQNGRVIANSFGAYLFLHAQAQLPSYPGKVLLLSPIVGDFGEENRKMFFIPPRADKIRSLAEMGAMPVPRECEVHVGSEDWQSNPANVLSLGKLLNIRVAVVSDAGHNLGKDYVGEVLDSWLSK